MYNFIAYINSIIQECLALRYPPSQWLCYIKCNSWLLLNLVIVGKVVYLWVMHTSYGGLLDLIISSHYKVAHLVIKKMLCLERDRLCKATILTSYCFSNDNCNTCAENLAYVYMCVCCRECDFIV